MIAQGREKSLIKVFYGLNMCLDHILTVKHGLSCSRWRLKRWFTYALERIKQIFSCEKVLITRGLEISLLCLNVFKMNDEYLVRTRREPRDQVFGVLSKF